MTGLSLRRRVREVWQKLALLDARPAQIAAGFAVGIAAGLVPLNPSPIILAGVVAWLLRMNMVSAIAGGTLAILYTPLLPLIWLAEYRTGGLLLAVKHPLSFDHASLLELAQMGWDVYAAMFLGAVIIATPISLATFLIVKKLAERWARLKSQSGHSV